MNGVIVFGATFAACSSVILLWYIHNVLLDIKDILRDIRRILRELDQ